jgi:flagellar biosynthesis protein FlhB
MQQAMLDGSGLMLDGLMAMVAVFVLFALIDVPAQAWFFAKNQRMSKQDLKEEHKSDRGPARGAPAHPPAAARWRGAARARACPAPTW